MKNLYLDHIYVLVYKGKEDVGTFGYLVEYDFAKDSVILGFEHLNGWRTHKQENCKLIFQIGDIITLLDGSKHRIKRISDNSICIDYDNDFKWINLTEINEYNKVMNYEKSIQGAC